MHVFYYSLRSIGHYVLASIDFETRKKKIFQEERRQGSTEEDFLSCDLSSFQPNAFSPQQKFFTTLYPVCLK